MDFKNYDDQELVYLVKENSEEAKNILFDKYKTIIDIVVNKYGSMIKMLNIDFNDVYQEAYLGLFDALDSYKDDKNASLKTFISLCVERKIQTYIKKCSRLKNKLINESLSLEHVYENSEHPLKDLIGDDNKNNPLRNVVDEESVHELMTKIKAELSDSEYEVFSLLINGLNYQEIAVLLDKKPKQVDNSIQRLRTKIKKNIAF